MGSNSLIPRAFDVRQAARAREEADRAMETRTSARNTSQTTVGSGGRLDIDGGDLTVQNGGNAVVKDGGRLSIEEGGGGDLFGNGELVIHGEGEDPYDGRRFTATATLSTREVFSSYSGGTYRVPGLFFGNEFGSGASLQAFAGDDPTLRSGQKPVTYGPLVGSNIVSLSSAGASPGEATLYSGAFDSTDPDPSGLKAYCTVRALPDAFEMKLRKSNVADYGSIRVSLADSVMRIFGLGGTDVSGPFTVDGVPVSGGGAVDSVNSKTGVVVLVKADIGLGNVDNTSDANKPVSTATGTALAGKASTAIATTSTNGLMSATDKVKLDGAIPGTWASVPASTGWQPQAGDAPKAKIINGVVYLAGTFQYIGAAKAVGAYYSSSQLLGILPAGYWPPNTITTQALANFHPSGATTACRLTIGSAGELRMYALAQNGVVTDFQIGSTTYLFLSSASAYPLP